MRWVLLRQNGSRSTIFSSFSAANPGGPTQMIRLGSDVNRTVMDVKAIATASGLSDRDSNDLIITNVNLPLF